jgi:hypothetical protein
MVGLSADSKVDLSETRKAAQLGMSVGYSAELRDRMKAASMVVCWDCLLVAC